MKNDAQKAAIELRQLGWSYKEIMEVVPVSKSTLSYWLRDIVLTEEQEKRLQQKIDDNRQSFPHSMSAEKRREASRKGGINNIKKHPEFAKNGGNANAASLAYKKTELPIKEQLEKITGMQFQKERINNKYIPYANDLYLIDYVKDIVKGSNWSIQRMEIIKDNRYKIIICDAKNWGPTYWQRLLQINLSTDNNIIVVDSNDFWAGKWIGIYTNKNNPKHELTFKAPLPRNL